MISFTIHTSEGKKKIDAPSSWEEITYRKMIRIESEWDKKNIVQLFAILIDIDYELVADSTDKKLDEVLYQICAFAFDNPKWEELKPPTQILWDEKIIKVPTDITQETLAQKIMMDNILRSEKLVWEVIPKAAAIYLHPRIDPLAKIDNDIMEKVAEKMLDRGAVEVYSIGNFFLQRLRGYKKSMLSSLLLKSLTHSKNLQASQD